MRHYTHEIPGVKTNKVIVIMLVAGVALACGLLVFIAVACSFYAQSIEPAMIILCPLLVLAVLIWMVFRDLKRAYVEIDGDNITVVDYCFCVRKTRQFLIRDIAKTEVWFYSAWRIRGYRLPGRYIVFRGKKDRYLFKVLYTPERLALFRKHGMIVSD